MVGMGAAVIGAVHRFLYDPTGFTSLACAMSTLFEGAVGSFVWLIFKRRERKQTTLSLFLITAFAECSQMGFILAIARPFSDALALVKVIAVPMTLVNSLGMILFFSVFDEVFTSQDLLAANKIRLALTIADECIPYIQKTARTRSDYDAMAEIIKKYANCNGVLFLERDGKTGLNDTKLVIPPELFLELCEENKSVAFCRVTDKKDVNYRYLRRYSAFGAPLTQGKVIWAYLVIFLPRQVLSTQAEMDFLEGFAKFFSTNYELAQVEKQKKLRQRAEYQALQSQINPHFLFNSLNTISFFCREKPERARELLLALSVYFRNTLEATDAYMIPLEKELAHVKAYLELEEARFEERLTVKINVDPVKAAAEGLSPTAVASQVYMMVSGTTATTLNVDGNDIDVKVEYADDEYDTIDKLQGIVLPTATGGSVALMDIADIGFKDSTQSITKSDKQYQVTITGTLTEGADSTTKDKIQKEVIDKYLSGTISMQESTSTKMMNEEFASLGQAIATAVFLVFIVMAAQFESPKFSIMVMTTIPFALIGSFLFLWLVDCPISMTSLLGFLMLVGTVVNNGILYVDTANQYRATMDFKEAVIEAGATRMRPMFMTTLTTIVAMIPMAAAYGNAGKTMQGLALVDVGGLIVSTAMALLVLPVFYVIMSGKNQDKKEIIDVD